MRIWERGEYSNIVVRQTVVEKGEAYLLVSTCDVSGIEHYPYETVIFYTDPDGEYLRGTISLRINKNIVRSYDREEALHSHINGIMIAIDFLHGRDV